MSWSGTNGVTFGSLSGDEAGKGRFFSREMAVQVIWGMRAQHYKCEPGDHTGIDAYTVQPFLQNGKAGSEFTGAPAVLWGLKKSNYKVPTGYTCNRDKTCSLGDGNQWREFAADLGKGPNLQPWVTSFFVTCAGQSQQNCLN
jgi:hypothetical protein